MQVSSQNAVPKLTRRLLKTLPLQSLHQARNWSKAEVSLFEWPPNSGQSVVLKDLRSLPLWLRILFGRTTLTREWKAMRALDGVSGVPRVIARPDADCLVMEFCAGKPLIIFVPDTLPPSVVPRIEECVTQFHARGVTHGDLHSRNVLIDPQGEIAFIDWASACAFDKKRNAWQERVFNELCALDRRAVAKIKSNYMPHAITEEEQQSLLYGSSPAYRAVKKLRYGFDRLRGRNPEEALQFNRGKYSDLSKHK